MSVYDTWDTMPSGSDSKTDAPDWVEETDKNSLGINTVQYMLPLSNVLIILRAQKDSTPGALYKGSSDTSKQEYLTHSIHSTNACWVS